jgi:hypothetical protein
MGFEDEEALLERIRHKDGIFEALWNTVTDPLVLITGALTFMFPLPTVRGLKSAAKSITPFGGPAGNVLGRQFFKPWNMFRDYADEIYKPLMGIAENKRWFNEQIATRLKESLDRFRSVARREPTRYELQLVAYKLDGLANELPSRFRHFRRPVEGADVGQLRSPFKPGVIDEEIAKVPGLDQLRKDTRDLKEWAYDEVVLSDPEMRSEIIKAMGVRAEKGVKLAPSEIGRRMDRGTLRIPESVKDQLRSTRKFQEMQGRVVAHTDDPTVRVIGGKIDEHFPHQLPRDLATFEQWIRKTLTPVPKSKHGKMIRMDDKVADSLLPSYEAMLPEVPHLRRFPHLLNKERMGELELAVQRLANDPKTGKVVYTRKIDPNTQMVNPVPPYSLEFENVLPRYFHQMGATYAHNKGGGGRKLHEAVAMLHKKGDWREAVLQDTYIPLASGRLDYDKALRMAEWAGTRGRMREFLDGPVGSKVFSGPLTRMGKDLRANLDEASGTWGHLSLEAPLTEIMYASALGLNTSPVILNSLQTILTTTPLAGIQHASKGLAAVYKKATKYFDLRYNRGLGHEEAFPKAFKEFHESGLGSQTMMREMFGEGMEQAYRKGAHGKFRKGWDRVRNSMLWMFQKVELTNRLTAFEAGRSLSKAGGGTADDMMDMGRWMVRETQFPSGWESSPYALTKLRAKPFGRLLSMFLQFPISAAEFAMSTATTAYSKMPIAQKSPALAWLGVKDNSLIGELIKPWHPGPLARMGFYGAVAWNAGKALGLDLERGLAFGLSPMGMEGAPFYPAPVPPILSLMGAAAMDLTAGEWNQMQYAAPLLVPGGVAAARAAGTLGTALPGVGYASEGLAKFLGRKYTDYTKPTADGRYPVYSSAGDTISFVGNMNVGQLVAQGLGVPISGGGRAESQVMEWLVKNRDRIREAKRTYLEALYNNDGEGATRVENQFQKAYPQLKRGLRSLIKKSDIRALQMRRDLTRIEKVLRTLPAEMRPLFTQAIMGSAVGTTGFLGPGFGAPAAATARFRNVGGPALSPNGTGAATVPSSPNVGGFGYLGTGGGAGGYR